MTAFANYDAWKLTPPWDTVRARKRFMPTSVCHPILIDQAGFVLDLYGHYDAETGALQSVQLEAGGDHIKADDVIGVVDNLLAALKISAPRWSDDLDDDTLSRLIDEAGADDEADWADSRRDY